MARARSQAQISDLFPPALAEAGFLAALIHKAYGGSELNLEAASVIMEKIQANGCNGSVCHAQMYVMNTALRHGSEVQKSLYLRRSPRSRVEFHRAQLLQLAADGGLIQRDREFSWSDWTSLIRRQRMTPWIAEKQSAFDQIDQCLALRVVKPGTGAGRLPASEPSGPRALHRMNQLRPI